jgi:hypothetical protein
MTDSAFIFSEAADSEITDTDRIEKKLGQRGLDRQKPQETDRTGMPMVYPATARPCN